MESLLPSEIARLVLGYLEEQKCPEAARLFLASSPHLQECRAVTSTGGRFGTKVHGCTLVDILEKFCAANLIIHERLSKVADCEQLKHCGDLLEQLRFLVDGSRGQRFVVNINVPTTSQASGGSPIISSSIRKRHHSGSDRDRSKRGPKSNPQISGKNLEPVSSQLSSDAVETTPLENLPGHSTSSKSSNILEKSIEVSEEILGSNNCSSTVPEATGSRFLPKEIEKSLENIESKLISGMEKTNEKTNEKCSAATDTEELMHYKNTEVQTTPYDAIESETESTYEPVENLSLLTKELLNRTELQERIAENINKAILPSDTSLRDISLCESINGEMNTSIMTELNNAIKSVVTATESDPIFAKFLDEIIGPDVENDESPDEDNDNRQINSEGLQGEYPALPKETLPEVCVPLENESSKSRTPEVPLKNRLRSSSSQQSVRPDDDKGISSENIQKDNCTALEDVNAAAVLSIINAINKSEEEKSKNEATSEMEIEMEKKIVEPEPVKEIQENIQSNAIKSMEIEKPISTSTRVNNDKRTTKKTNVRKPRNLKPKTKIPAVPEENLMSEEDIMAMPTLIVCSKEEISTIINATPIITESVNAPGYCASKFLPIAPKTSEIMALPPKPEPIYLRAVTVPTKVSNAPKIIMETSQQALKSWPAVQCNIQANRPSIGMDINTPEILSTSVCKIDQKNSDKITLYGNENNRATVFENSLDPLLQVDDSPNTSGTGLSPFLKFNKEAPKEIGLSVPTINIEDDVPLASTSKNDNYDHITKRTPRSLLKSRSKNNRLSLSTPRRRSSHIRALDFNTPSKSIKTNRRMSTNESIDYSPKTFGKKVCRASLFKSPPFATTPTPKKVKSPPKDRGPCKLPIATRSPAPKLLGGWEKYTGVGIILGSTSPSSASSSPIKTTMIPLKATGKSWDEDLRKSLLPIEETEVTTSVKKKTVKRKPSQTSKPWKKKNNTGHTVLSDEGSSGCESIKERPKNKPNSLQPSISSAEKDIDDKEHLEKSEISKPEVLSSDKNFDNVSNISNSLKNIENVETKVVESLSSNDGIVKSTKKKYAKLKTITTSLTRIERSSEISGNKSLTMEKKGEYSCPEKSRTLNLPDMLELETPRKLDDNFGIPPTPRLLSPGTSLTTPFGLLGDDVTKLRGFVTTPEFPPTPSINLTPKQNSLDGKEKKEDSQLCSEYYEPGVKPKDPRTKRNDNSRHDMSLPLPGMMMAIAAETRVKNISLEVARGFQASTSTNKLEITQFEVIKENLPREEAFRELKISVSSNSNFAEKKENINEMINVIDETNELSQLSSEEDCRERKDPNNTSSTIDDSSDSDSDSSSSDSSSSSSTSSSSSSATNTSPNLTFNKTSSISTSSKNNDTINDLSEKSLKNSEIVREIHEECPIKENIHTTDTASMMIRENNENSPTKVFPITKNDQELENCITETPAKDESLLIEAVISETPSSSKLGIETTNLNSKISALISSENRETTNEQTNEGMKKILPKVVNVQRILPNVSIAMKTSGVAEHLNNAMQSKNHSKTISDAKLSKQLEEKRLRLMAKIKDKEKAPIHRPRIKRSVAVTKGQKNPSEKETNIETEEKNEITIVKDKDKDIDKGSKDNKSLEKTTEDKDSRTEKCLKKIEIKKRLPKETIKILESKRIEDTEDVSLKKDIDEEKEKLAASENINEDKEKVKITNEEGAKIGKKDSYKKPQKKQKDNVKEKMMKKVDAEEVEEDTAKKFENKKKSKIESSNNSTEAGPNKIEKLNYFEESKVTVEKKCSEPIKPEERIVGESSVQKDKNFPTIDENSQQNSENLKMDKIESISVTVDMKIVTKSKVDLVKRDLFSDEESNDQRTTRSRTRQNSDLQKNESSESQISSRCSEKNNSSPRSNENMPGVLECLDLVPNIKNDNIDEDFDVLDGSQKRHHAEYHFIYDENSSTKKRKRKFSNSELEFPVEVELSDDNYRKCPKLMKATIFEEIFNLTPPRKKRTTKDIKLTNYKKKESSNVKKVKTVFKGLEEKPLATSSPVYKSMNSKIIGKIIKSPKKNENPQIDGRKKGGVKIDVKQTEDEKRNPKTRKRKASGSKDIEQVEKKSRSTNPQLLLNKLDLDKFLTTVHGPP